MVLRNGIARLLIGGSALSAALTGIGHTAATTAMACGAVNFTQPGGGSNYSPAGAPAPTETDPALDVVGYSLSGSGGKVTATITLGAPPAVVTTSGSDATSYQLVWDKGNKPYFAKLTLMATPSTPVSNQYTYQVGSVDSTLPLRRYVPDYSVPVTGSVDGSTITMTFPYGSNADASFDVSATGAYSSVVRTAPYVSAAGQNDPLPTHGLSTQTDAAPEGASLGAEAGPGGNPFC